jgi:ElaB/YqjD/DUF883 family membrane-anchored ribosome-binding protein
VAPSISSWFGRGDGRPAGSDPAAQAMPPAEDPRIRALDAEVARLRAEAAARPTIDLTQLDELELTQLASETAVTIVRAAHKRRDELLSEAEILVREAGEQSGAAVDSARRQVEELRLESERQAEQTRSNAESRADAIRADADDYLRRSRSEADTYASNTRSEADGYASRLRGEADTYATQVRGEADTYASSTRTRIDEQADEARRRTEAEQVEARARFEAEIETTRAEFQQQIEELFAQAESVIAEAREQAKSIEAEGHEERERILQEAYDRRDALLETIEKQRRWVNVLVQDAAELRSHAVESFDEVRGLIDAAVSRLNAPADGADRVLADIDTEVRRLSTADADLSADAARQRPRDA